MSYEITTFNFTSKDNKILNMNYVMVYTMNKEWVHLQPIVSNPNTSNPGIQYYSYSQTAFSDKASCVIKLYIDPKIVNATPYASDNARLLFSVNGSNYHVNINSNGSMDCTGIFGPNSGAVKWEGSLAEVGKTSNIICKGS